MMQVTVVVSDQTRDDIWQEMLDSDRLARYYEAVADTIAASTR